MLSQSLRTVCIIIPFVFILLHAPTMNRGFFWRTPTTKSRNQQPRCSNPTINFIIFIHFQVSNCFSPSLPDFCLPNIAKSKFSCKCSLKQFFLQVLKLRMIHEGKTKKLQSVIAWKLLFSAAVAQSSNLLALKNGLFCLLDNTQFAVILPSDMPIPHLCMVLQSIHRETNAIMITFCSDSFHDSYWLTFDKEYRN